MRHNTKTFELISEIARAPSHSLIISSPFSFLYFIPVLPPLFLLLGSYVLLYLSFPFFFLFFFEFLGVYHNRWRVTRVCVGIVVVRNGYCSSLFSDMVMVVIVVVHVVVIVAMS